MTHLIDRLERDEKKECESLACDPYDSEKYNKSYKRLGEIQKKLGETHAQWEHLINQLDAVIK